MRESHKTRNCRPQHPRRGTPQVTRSDVDYGTIQYGRENSSPLGGEGDNRTEIAQGNDLDLAIFHRSSDFRAVLSIVITLGGGIALFTLPIAMYPPIAPPTVQVDCAFPGASAQVVAQTVATPIEQQVNGVENMLYMSSQCTNDGAYNLTVTFRHGVNLNMAQVLVQNRVSLAVPNLPDVIKQTGVTTRKKSPDILLALALTSPNKIAKSTLSQ